MTPLALVAVELAPAALLASTAFLAGVGRERARARRRRRARLRRSLTASLAPTPPLLPARTALDGAVLELLTVAQNPRGADRHPQKLLLRA
jgi:hypothetical protein